LEEADKMARTLALSATRRRAFSRHRGEQSRFLIAAALFIVVLIAEALVVVLAAPTLADVASLYTATL